MGAMRTGAHGVGASGRSAVRDLVHGAHGHGAAFTNPVSGSHPKQSPILPRGTGQEDANRTLTKVTTHGGAMTAGQRLRWIKLYPGTGGASVQECRRATGKAIPIRYSVRPVNETIAHWGRSDVDEPGPRGSTRSRPELPKRREGSSGQATNGKLSARVWCSLVYRLVPSLVTSSPQPRNLRHVS